MTHEELCRCAPYGVSIPSVLSLVIGLEPILSIARSVLSGVSPSEAISAGSNVLTSASRSAETGFKALAGHGEKWASPIDSSVCLFRKDLAEE